MITIAEYHQSIDAKISDAIFSNDLQPSQLYDPIRYILSNGGKRIRSILTLLACQSYGAGHQDAIAAATGLEIFHNFTLLHDDIMDNASIRRGKPTVHVQWDVNTAILSGDAMMIVASDLVAEAPAQVLKNVLKLFNKTALQVCEGQQLDMMLESVKLDDSSNTSSTYIEMIRLKTSVLLAACLQIGALIGGANESEQKIIYNAGISLGLGFQLQDDLLDSFGEEESFGKKIGGDIIARKKTYLVSSAFESGTPSQRKRIIELYNADDLTELSLIRQVQDIFVETGAKVATEKLIDQYFERAFVALKQTQPIDLSAKKQIEVLFKQISERSF